MPNNLQILPIPLPKPFYVSSDDYSTSTPPPTTPTTPTTQSSPFAPFLTPLDADMVSRVLDLAEKCTAAFEDFDYARSLEMAENFFWSFTDDYIELVKTRAYGQKSSQYSQDETNSAKTALQICLLMQLQLFCPLYAFCHRRGLVLDFPRFQIHSQIRLAKLKIPQ